MVNGTISRLDIGIRYRDYFMGPTDVLLWDPCPFGLPVILAVAQMDLIDQLLPVAFAKLSIDLRPPMAATSALYDTTQGASQLILGGPG